MRVVENGNSIELDEKTLCISLTADGQKWGWPSDYRPRILMKDGSSLYFDEAGEQRHEEIQNGVGSGILSRYAFRGITEFETYVWTERASGDFRFEFIPLSDQKGSIAKVFWPGPMEFRQTSASWYTLLTQGQGLLIPNNWDRAEVRFSFEGRFLSADAYMPWFAQLRGNEGFLAIAETPWDAGILTENHSWTEVSPWWEPSLGQIGYRRVLRYRFLSDCDYNTIAKEYRRYVFERGHLVTLKEKAVRNPNVEKLIGAKFIHCGIKAHVDPASDLYDRDNPSKNDCLTSFEERAAMVSDLAGRGIGKFYLHLDGWAEPGYDNRHPDYLPACEKAGGWEGLKRLADVIHASGGSLGLHDQYRDYYHDAPSYSEDYAVRLPDGSIPAHSRWAGGRQSYLCATQAPYYLRRNLDQIRAHKVQPDAMYLDVFSCNEADECDNPRHRMSRRECYGRREECFQYLRSLGILPSSEETADWSMDSLVFCHYAPYSFMLREPEEARPGIAVPLFNLVYHDCVIIPWMMEKHEQEDYMLHALLNGGAPYLLRLPAYEGVDGTYEGLQMSMEENIARCSTVSDLHEKVACCELLSHRFLDDTGFRQESRFDDGTAVTVDFSTGNWEIH